MLHGLLWLLSLRLLADLRVLAFRTQVLPVPSNHTSQNTAAQPGDGSQLPETAAVAGEARMLHKAPTVGVYVVVVVVDVVVDAGVDVGILRQ